MYSTYVLYILVTLVVSLWCALENPAFNILKEYMSLFVLINFIITFLNIMPLLNVTTQQFVVQTIHCQTKKAYPNQRS